MDKPKTLYRGIKIDYNHLADFEFTNVPITLNYEPIIDEYGRKTVKDGNEYGIYMTDNLNMVLSAYGSLYNDGIPLAGRPTLNNRLILIPSIALIYEINPDGLNIRKPFITDVLKGHYNNGFEGSEYITDYIPASNYKLYRVRIGGDLLHDEEDIDVTQNDLKEIVTKKLEKRRYHLELFANVLKNIPASKTNMWGKEELSILKSIYGDNGVKYLSENSIDTSNLEGMFTYLIAKTFKENELDIDFKTIKYLHYLKGHIKTLGDLERTIKTDIAQNAIAKEAFIKEKAGKSYVTTKFDNEKKALKKLETWLLQRKRLLLQKNYQEMMNAASWTDNLEETAKKAR